MAGDEGATTTVVGKQHETTKVMNQQQATTTVPAEPKKKWQPQEQPQPQQQNPGPPVNTTTSDKNLKDLVKKRLGSEEHSAISQVLSSQQDQFQQQVQELHSISQRQWQHVSKTLFPYLESFRPKLSSAQTATAASPLFSHEHQKAAAVAMNQAASVAMNQAANAAMQKNWWHDPMKVMGIQNVPAFVHASQSNQMQASGSNQMESTMIGSHHPSMYSAGQQQRQQMPPASSSGWHESSAVTAHHPQAQRAKQKRHNGDGLSQDPNGGPQGKASKRQKDGRAHHRHSLTGKSNRDLDTSQAKGGPLSCPQPKKATPQSAIDILLALSEATSADREKGASQIKAQSQNHSQTQLAGAAERIAAKKENEKDKKQES